jgi:hypothetical protein
VRGTEDRLSGKNRRGTIYGCTRALPQDATVLSVVHEEGLPAASGGGPDIMMTMGRLLKCSCDYCGLDYLCVHLGKRPTKEYKSNKTGPEVDEHILHHPLAKLSCPMCYAIKLFTVTPVEELPHDH